MIFFPDLQIHISKHFEHQLSIKYLVSLKTTFQKTMLFLENFWYTLYWTKLLYHNYYLWPIWRVFNIQPSWKFTNILVFQIIILKNRLTYTYPYLYSYQYQHVNSRLFLWMFFFLFFWSYKYDMNPRHHSCDLSDNSNTWF